jgi:stage III sporulation protein SpoIIIAA
MLQEVSAARTIAERGVVLIGTAHGNNLSNLMRNPVLRPLVGGVTTVTLGDEMARKMNNNNKVSRASSSSNSSCRDHVH